MKIHGIIISVYNIKLYDITDSSASPIIQKTYKKYKTNIKKNIKLKHTNL